MVTKIPLHVWWFEPVSQTDTPRTVRQKGGSSVSAQQAGACSSPWKQGGPSQFQHATPPDPGEQQGVAETEYAVTSPGGSPGEH